MYLHFLSIVLLINAFPPGHTEDSRSAVDQTVKPRPTIRHNSDGSTEYVLLIVTDLDRESKADNWTWRAVTRQGRLTLNLSGRKPQVKITWDSEKNLTSNMNVKGRAMELSDLSVFHNRILTPDDRTGMISEIKGDKIIPWVFLNSGPGNTTDAFKCEWMTIKDDLLYVGSHGNEFKGKVTHKNNMWVKTVTPWGEVTNLNWIDVYDRMRAATGISEQGYLTHEAVQWSKSKNRWFFLPRKASNTSYVELEDETKGTNLLISSPDLKHFDFVTVGRQFPKRGYSAFDFIPGTNDELIVALKSKEVTGESTASFITVFNISGQVVLKDERLDGDYKFEGLYFI
ncbi:hypothetical protein V3C99_005490 [Haemonchus contortus]